MTMETLRQILEALFLKLRSEQQTLALLALLCCFAISIYTVTLMVRRIRPVRRYRRRLLGRPVLISWLDGKSLEKSDDGFLQDVSVGGIGLDLPFPLKARTRLNFRLSEANLSGAGQVCRCTRVGARHRVGVRLDPLSKSLVSLQLRDAAESLVQESTGADKGL